MADEDLRGRAPTVERTPAQALYGEFTLGMEDGDSLLFSLPSGAQVLDALASVATEAVGTAQVGVLGLYDTAFREVIGAFALTGGAPALLRMGSGGQQSLATTGTVRLRRGFSVSLTQPATVRVALTVRR